MHFPSQPSTRSSSCRRHRGSFVRSWGSLSGGGGRRERRPGCWPGRAKRVRSYCADYKAAFQPSSQPGRARRDTPGPWCGSARAGSGSSAGGIFFAAAPRLPEPPPWLQPPDSAGRLVLRHRQAEGRRAGAENDEMRCKLSSHKKKKKKALVSITFVIFLHK